MFVVIAGSRGLNKLVKFLFFITFNTLEILLTVLQALALHLNYDTTRALREINLANLLV